MPFIRSNAEKNRYRLLLVLVDALVGAGTSIMAQVLVLGVVGFFAQPPENVPLYALLLPSWLLSLYIHGQYEFHPRWLGLAGAYRTARAAVAGTLACIALVYFINRGQWLSRSVYAYATCFAAMGFSLIRVGAIKLYPERLLRERYLLLGTVRTDGELARALSNGELPLYTEFAGCLTDDAEAGAEGQVPQAFRILGATTDIERVVTQSDVSHVAVSPDAPRTAALARAASQAEALGAIVQRLETVYEDLTGRAPVLLAGADWGEGLSSVHQLPYMTRSKRVLEVGLTLLVLPVALVLMGLAAIAIKVFAPGPVLYRQQRVGLRGRPFTFLKLRTMVVDAERDTGAVWAVANDPRITPVGRILRKLRLDELPQLFHVLRGEMSLVGPRPERPKFVAEFTESIPFYQKRLLVRPGITGWAQINHPYDQSIDDVVEKLRFDLYYVRHVSFTLDLQILLRTFWVMLGRKGAH